VDKEPEYDLRKKPALLFTSEETGETWALPQAVVAHDRATYYAKKDPETTYKEEFDFTMEDFSIASDWFRNNMDPEEVIDKFILLEKPKGISLAEKIREYTCRRGAAHFFTK
jgi:hypothetical protein